MRRLLRPLWVSSVRHAIGNPPPNNPRDVSQDPTIPPQHREMLHELQQVLRKGVQPVATVTSLLTERSLAVVADCGGMSGVVLRYNSLLTMRHDEHGVNYLGPVGAMVTPRSLLLQEMGALLRRRGGPTPIDDLVLQLSDEMKAIARREGGLRRIAQSNPTMFTLLGDTHVLLVDGAAVTTATPSSVPPAPAPADPAMGVDPLMQRVFVILLRHVPFNCFVPMTALIDSLSTAEAQVIAPRSASREAMVEALGQLPPTLIDIRVLGDGPEATFLRLVGDGVPVTNAQTEQGDAHFTAMAALPVGNLLAKHITDVVDVTNLDAVLPPQVAAQLPLKGYESILVFDRLQHLFDVDVQAYRVRPKQTPHTFNTYSTPTPRALRYALTALAKAPLSADQLQVALPHPVAQEIIAAWRTVGQFVEAHPTLMFFVDGLVTLPSHRRAQTASQQASFEENPRALIDAVYEMLPADRCVPWVSIIKKIPRDALESRLMRDPREFFSKYPERLATYDPRWTVGWLIARKELPPPVGIHAPVRDIHDVLKELAKASVGGCDESTIMNMLSKDARDVVKSIGMEHLAQQLPEWFNVVNPTQTVGQAVLTYIGHHRGPPPTRTEPPMVLSHGAVKR